MKDAYRNLLAILIGVGFLLGVSLYQRGQPGTASPSRPPSAPQVTNQGAAADIFKVPGADATNEEKRLHFEAVSKVAVDGSSLEIKDCHPTPMVLRLPIGTKISVKNSDKQEHVIGLDAQNQYHIPPESQKDIVFNFSHGPGLYGYGCETISGTAGFFIVTSK